MVSWQIANWVHKLTQNLLPAATSTPSQRCQRISCLCSPGTDNHSTIWRSGNPDEHAPIPQLERHSAQLCQRALHDPVGEQVVRARCPKCRTAQVGMPRPCAQRPCPRPLNVLAGGASASCSVCVAVAARVDGFEVEQNLRVLTAPFQEVIDWLNGNERRSYASSWEGAYSFCAKAPFAEYSALPTVRLGGNGAL